MAEFKEYRSSGKESILALVRLLSKKPQSAPTLQRRLAGEYGIKRERKTIYDDMATLTLFLPVIYVPRKGYCLSCDPMEQEG